MSPVIDIPSITTPSTSTKTEIPVPKPATSNTTPDAANNEIDLSIVKASGYVPAGIFITSPAVAASIAPCIVLLPPQIPKISP